MSIDPNIIAVAALHGARNEVHSNFPTRTAMGWMWGRASAAETIKSTMVTQAALNEIRFLTLDYAYRHKLYV